MLLSLAIAAVSMIVGVIGGFATIPAFRRISHEQADRIERELHETHEIALHELRILRDQTMQLQPLARVLRGLPPGFGPGSLDALLLHKPMATAAPKPPRPAPGRPKKVTK